MNPSPDLWPLAISVATTCAATLTTFFLGLWAARRMYRIGGAIRPWIDGVLTLPLVLPPTVVGFLLLLLFGRRSPVGQLLEKVGVTIVFSWPATVIAATVVAFPLMYRTTLAAFEQVNPTMLHAARTLGASEKRVFWRILFPLAKPGILAGTILSFARALGEFGATLMLAGNIPGRTQTMPIAIFSAAGAGDMRMAFVWMAVMVGLSLAIIRLLHSPQTSHAARQAPPTAATQNGDDSRGQQQRLDADLPPMNSLLEVDIQRDLGSFMLDVKFQAGDGTVGLLGASGAGKSMTLHLISGVSRADEGRIVLNGRVLFDSAAGILVPPAARRIGVVFQDYALFPHLTVTENVAFGLHEFSAPERSVRVQQLLKGLHIAELAEHYPAQLSGGQRQRAAIARCMAIEPDALLFDEPFAALDPHLRRRTEEQLRETLRSYRGAVIFVTHDMEEAFRFCNELIVLEKGSIIASGPKHMLFERPGCVAAARLTGCKNIVPAARIDDSHVLIEDWECTLQLAKPHQGAVGHVGYRSHQFKFQRAARDVNAFLCWLMETSEAPHEMTLYLRLHQPPQPGDAPHLQADLTKDRWAELALTPQPWTIQLDPARLMVLED